MRQAKKGEKEMGYYRNTIEDLYSQVLKTVNILLTDRRAARDNERQISAKIIQDRFEKLASQVNAKLTGKVTECYHAF